MAFFRKLKGVGASKHRKLTEEWALATSMKEIAVHSDDTDVDSDEPETFTVKYLGNTIIDAARSEEATAEAVKSVISTAKNSHKKLQRVNLCISPKGIEVFDAVTGETLMQVSIYKISYCSADAAHSDVFAFVGTDDFGEGIDPLDEQLVCYAFLCPKRKIAQKVTLTVAHSFELAYQIWREQTQRQQFQMERRARKAAAAATATNGSSSDNSTTSPRGSGSSNSCSDDDNHDLLIDLRSDICGDVERHRDLLQNTWVSFDEPAQQQHSSPHSTTNVWDTKLMNFS